MSDKEITKYLIKKYGIAALINIPISATLGAIGCPAVMSCFKSKNGKIVGVIVGMLGSGMLSAILAIKAADSFMKEINPGKHEVVEKVLKEIDLM